MARSPLDMSLDDLIRARHSKNDGRRYNSAAPSPSLSRRNRIPNFRTNTNRLAPYSHLPKAPDSPWEHDLYTPHMGPLVGPFEGSSSASALGSGSAIELTKLFVSNLDYAVTDEDIQELFSVIGEIKHYSINYDRTGRSEGTAEVVFARHADALAAVKRYDGMLLDGKPIKIDIVGKHLKAPLPLPPVVAPLPYAGVLGNLKASMRRWSSMNLYIDETNGNDSGGFGGRQGLPGGGGFGAEARDQGQGGYFNGGLGGGGSKVKRKELVPVSAADLDAELDTYRASAKQTI
ncbi:THO complex subunit 4 [Rhynchospora pubera]|uniref:THO complex subunit 4 n=1 Tax=Rhynchospora pubera TaxID=906938 RepID=A0AAV8GWE2_9POAL|nr:THO complex subunit 4 [Rhynchospora pubera]